MKEGGMGKEERKKNLDEMEGTSSRRQKKVRWWEKIKGLKTQVHSKLKWN